MKIDFSTVLTGLDGRPLKRAVTTTDGAPDLKDWTAGAVAADALLAQAPNAPSLTVPQTAERYSLALQLHAEPVDFDLTAAQATMLQDAVVKTFPPMLAGPMILLTDGK